MDDEMSGDERGRSPRGASGFATRACDAAEKSIASNKEPLDFGGRRRGQQAFGGDAFGKAPDSRFQRQEFEDDCGFVDSKPSTERVTELRDYSSKVWTSEGRGSSHRAQSHAALDPMHSDRADAARKERDEKELGLLTGRASKRPKQDATEVSTSNTEKTVTLADKMQGLRTKSGQKNNSSSSSSSSSHKKKKKKHGKEKKSKDKKSKKKKKDKKAKKRTTKNKDRSED